jgi:hypothetical protein
VTVRAYSRTLAAEAIENAARPVGISNAKPTLPAAIGELQRVGSISSITSVGLPIPLPARAAGSLVGHVRESDGGQQGSVLQLASFAVGAGRGPRVQVVARHEPRRGSKWGTRSGWFGGDGEPGMVVWRYNDHTLAVILGSGLLREELIAAAARATPATDAEWAALVASGGFGRATTEVECRERASADSQRDSARSEWQTTR